MSDWTANSVWNKNRIVVRILYLKNIILFHKHIETEFIFSFNRSISVMKMSVNVIERASYNICSEQNLLV